MASPGAVRAERVGGLVTLGQSLPSESGSEWSIFVDGVAVRGVHAHVAGNATLVAGPRGCGVCGLLFHSSSDCVDLLLLSLTSEYSSQRRLPPTVRDVVLVSADRFYLLHSDGRISDESSTRTIAEVPFPGGKVSLHEDLLLLVDPERQCVQIVDPLTAHTVWTREGTDVSKLPSNLRAREAPSPTISVASPTASSSSPSPTSSPSASLCPSPSSDPRVFVSELLDSLSHRGLRRIGALERAALSSAHMLASIVSSMEVSLFRHLLYVLSDEGQAPSRVAAVQSLLLSLTSSSKAACTKVEHACDWPLLRVRGKCFFHLPHRELRRRFQSECAPSEEGYVAFLSAPSTGPCLGSCHFPDSSASASLSTTSSLTWAPCLRLLKLHQRFCDLQREGCEPWEVATDPIVCSYVRMTTAKPAVSWASLRSFFLFQAHQIRTTTTSALRGQTLTLLHKVPATVYGKVCTVTLSNKRGRGGAAAESREVVARVTHRASRLELRFSFSTTQDPAGLPDQALLDLFHEHLPEQQEQSEDETEERTPLEALPERMREVADLWNEKRVEDAGALLCQEGAKLLAHVTAERRRALSFAVKQVHLRPRNAQAVFDLWRSCEAVVTGAEPDPGPQLHSRNQVSHCVVQRRRARMRRKEEQRQDVHRKQLEKDEARRLGMDKDQQRAQEKLRSERLAAKRQDESQSQAQAARDAKTHAKWHLEQSRLRRQAPTTTTTRATAPKEKKKKISNKTKKTAENEMRRTGTAGTTAGTARSGKTRAPDREERKEAQETRRNRKPAPPPAKLSLTKTRSPTRRKTRDKARTPSNDRSLFDKVDWENVVDWPDLNY